MGYPVLGYGPICGFRRALNVNWSLFSPFVSFRVACTHTGGRAELGATTQCICNDPLLSLTQGFEQRGGRFEIFSDDVTRAFGPQDKKRGSTLGVSSTIPHSVRAEKISRKSGVVDSSTTSLWKCAAVSLLDFVGRW